MASSRIKERRGISLCCCCFSIPEIEKESNQTFEVIFGIRKKYVVVGLEEMGICTSLGREPVGSGDFGRDWLSMCLAGLAAWVECGAGKAVLLAFPLFPRAANLRHFLHALGWKLDDPPSQFI